MSEPQKILVQYLIDTGADQKTVERFSALLEHGSHQQQMSLLREQRALFLENLHKSQHSLDLLDQLICFHSKTG